ncbi:hypothetical protein N8T08_009814 [Aspergillus melleus]|uniref:Uncharacterized protein n=1 Tax=Aspergillus melleus TaxID=138277 RepID=A0ACC3ASM1_9EURO|nr:hypothetical protein N8T08_009814 [Aspergillus melleus]
MKFSTSVTLFSLAAMATAHPRGLWWGTDTCYPSPENSDNDCSEEQRTGFNWGGIGEGDFSHYGGFDFSGFAMKHKFSGAVSGGFGGKCIEGKVGKGSSSGLRFNAGKAFSVGSLRLATSKKADVHVVYGMPDGSSCKQVASCSPEGTDVRNEQCGGATSVHFQLPEDHEDDECDLGIHTIDFDCTPGTKNPDHSIELPSHTATPPSHQTSAHGHSSSVPVIPGHSTTHGGAVTSPAPSTPVRMTTSTVYATSEITITSCAPTVTNCPADSTTVVTSTIPVSTTVCPVTETEGGENGGVPTPTGVSPGGGSTGPSGPAITSPAVTGPSPTDDEDVTTTLVTYETVTTCPVTETATEGGKTTTSVYETVSTVTLTSTSTICTKCTASATAPPAVPTSVGPIGSSSAFTPAPSDYTTTVMTYETVTTCPVTETATEGGKTTTSVYETVSTVTQTSTATYCPKCAESTPVAPPTEAIPTDVAPVTTPAGPAVTTIVTYETVTTCPVTETVTDGDKTSTHVRTTVSTLTTTSASVITPTGVAPVTTPVAPVTTPAGPAVTTIVTYETVTTCPVTETVTEGDKTTTHVRTTVSTLTTTSASVVVPTGVAPTGKPPVVTGSVPETPETPEQPSTPCPNVVPKCINTWLTKMPKCGSNSEAGCFCPSAEFTDKVISCVQAWGASDEEVQAALSYFTGICAAYVPQNPGIVTAIPSTITLVPSAGVPSTTGVSPVTQAPKPTGGVTSPETTAPAAPAPPVPVSATTITYSSYTVTVPQVAFSTATSGHQTTVGLIPGPAPTGVSPGGNGGNNGGAVTTIPNPWGPSSTWVKTHAGSSTAAPTPSSTIPLSNDAASAKAVSFWWGVGIAAMMGIVY